MTPAKKTTTDNEEESGIHRRRVPRRTFKAPVGVLMDGKYVVQRAYQLGEGGMMVDCKSRKLVAGKNLVLNFFLPDGSIVMVRGIVRAVVPAKDGQPERYGLEFLNLEFQSKRAIRNFVAAASREDGHSTTTSLF